MKIWKCIYGFGEENGDVLVMKTVSFELYIIINDGAFTGRFIDSEYLTVCEEEIKINGFFEDNFVSFVLTYPFRKIYNEIGEPSILMEKVNQEVTYYGEFLDDSGKISGEWEILEQSYFDADKVSVIFSHGNFEMQETDS